MKDILKITGRIAAIVFLLIAITLGIGYCVRPNPIETEKNIRQELISELDTNKKVVVFEFERFTDTIEQEQKILDLLINDGLDRNYTISTVEIIEGNGIIDRTILIFENGY